MSSRDELPGPDHHIRIDDGIHVATYVGSVGFYFLGRSPRVALCFRIPDLDGSEDRVFGFYNVKKLMKNGSPIRTGTRVPDPEFDIGWRSRLSRDLGMLFPYFSPKSLPTEIPPIRGQVLLQTTTVCSDHEGFERPEAFRSSKVARIIGWADSNEE